MMVPFVGQAYQHRSLSVSAQRTVNMYPELIKDANAKSRYILQNCPGTVLYRDLSGITDGACRGIYEVAAIDNIANVYQTRVFSVYGDKLIEDTGTQAIERATISNLTSRVSFCDTGNELVFVDGTTLYVYDLETNTLNTPTVPFQFPTECVFLDERVLVINRDTTKDVVNNYNKVYYSALSNPNSWGGADWYNAKGSADPIVSISKRQGETWLFGPKSFEVWRTTTNADSPYSRVGGSFGEIGCGAPDSVADIAENVFWLGSSKAGKNQVYVSDGYNARRISTHAIEDQLDQIANTSDAVGFTYQFEGHTMYCLTFIGGNQTWEYDLSTDQWHERTTRDPLLNIENRWAPIFATFGNNEILMGSLAGPFILKLDVNARTDYDPSGDLPVICTRQSPTYWDELNLVFHKEFQVDMETGVGLQTGQGSVPRIMLQYSDDGGYTWSNERWIELGRVGQRKVRARWRRLGRARDRVYRIKVSDPVPVRMLGGRAITQKGRV